MTDQVEQLFVYGTLMPEKRLHSHIEQHVRNARPGLVKGVLIDMGAFPALIPGDGLVKGILLEIDPEAIEITDRIEGHRSEPETGFYHRKRFCVRLEDGQEVDAWAYELASPHTAAHCPPLVVGRVDGRPLYAWFPSSEGRSQPDGV